MSTQPQAYSLSHAVTLLMVTALCIDAERWLGVAIAGGYALLWLLQWGLDVRDAARRSG